MGLIYYTQKRVLSQSCIDILKGLGAGAEVILGQFVEWGITGLYEVVEVFGIRVDEEEAC